MKAVLFDFDMTLVDSSYAMLQSFDKISTAFHKPKVSYQKLLQIIGFHDQRFWNEAFGEMTDEMMDFYRNSCRPFEDKDLRLMDGAGQVLERLKSQGVLLGLATNRFELAPALLSDLKLDHILDCSFCVSMVEHPKPSPDMLLSAMDRLGVRPEETVYVGDAPVDIEAGKRAGVRVAVLTTSTSEAVLKQRQPWKICDSWAELGRVFQSELLEEVKK